MKLQKTLHLTSKIIFNVMAVVLALFLIVSTLLVDPDVESLLTAHVFKDKPEDVTVSTGKEPVRFKTWYSSVDDLLDGNGEIAWLTQAEGTVLLKNNGNALPLAAGSKVSLYGVTAYDPMYCLDGAGNNKINDPAAYNGRSEVNRRQFFYDKFEDAGLVMNSKLRDWYNSDAGKHYRRRDYVGFWGLNGGLGYDGNDNGKVPALTEANWDEVNSDAKDYGNFGKNTTAIYITGRMTNESADLNKEGGGSSAAAPNGNNDGLKGSTDYLAFTDDEKNLLRSLGENYDKVIVIFNQANPPQNDIPALLDEYGIEAAMWIGFPGSDGIKAVAEILTGKINPSGGLSAAWYTSRNANPSTNNFAVGGDNVINVEGMYVGYRYAETRYEDTLKASAKADAYDYGANVSYPFGYGLSYTTFEYTDIELVKDEDPEKNYYTGGVMASNDKNYTGNRGEKRPDEELRATGSSLGDCDDLIMKVTVRNSGSVAGKEIVQIYLQQPITDTDRAHGVQKPSVQLIGYGKTGMLESGASETVEIKIDANKWFAAYDSRLTDKDNNIIGGYVLGEGDYKLAVARNAHEAVNSIYKAGGGNPDNAAFDGDYGAGNADNVQTVTVSARRSASYKYWTQGTTDDVRNLFADIDPNMDDNTSNDVKFFSRYDWNGTASIDAKTGRIGENASAKTGAALGKTDGFDSGSKLSSGDIDAFAEYYDIEFDTTDYVFGWSSTEYQLVDLIGVEYDPARGASEEDVKKWKDFVGQMAKTDFDRLFYQGLRKTLSVESIGKPGTNDQNASNGLEWAIGLGNGDRNGDFENKNANYGFRNKFDSASKIAYPTGYPCEGIVAATYNNEIAYLVGQAIGEDALWSGCSGLYGFGLGLQRNPYHGRAGEFYSDDSFLTGMIGGLSTLGAQSKGLYVYNKHFVLNDQETNRSSYRAWLNEQTFRQIYLRPFEMAIEIGDAMNVMIAFNQLGDAWTGSNYNLMTRWLRGEAGMAGFSISDYYYSPGENIGYGMLSGACLLDGDNNGGGGYCAGVDARYDNRLVEAATRILYTVANSNAMNFWGDDTRTYSFDALWLSGRDAFVKGGGTAIYVVFALSAAFVLGTTVWGVLIDKGVLKAKSEEKAE